MSFQEVDHEETKKHLRLSNGGKMVDLSSYNAIITVVMDRLINKQKDEVTFRVKRSNFSYPFIGVTGLKGEFNAVIGKNIVNPSRYWNQGISMNMDKVMYKKGEFIRNTAYSLADRVEDGDVIRMTVNDGILSYYHNGKHLYVTRTRNKLDKNKDYKFAVTLVYNTCIEIL